MDQHKDSLRVFSVLRCTDSTQMSESLAIARISLTQPLNRHSKSSPQQFRWIKPIFCCFHTSGQLIPSLDADGCLALQRDPLVMKGQQLVPHQNPCRQRKMVNSVNRDLKETAQMRIRKGTLLVRNLQEKENLRQRAQKSYQ
jgi:hypothetical protein